MEFQKDELNEILNIFQQESAEIISSMDEKLLILAGRNLTCRELGGFCPFYLTFSVRFSDFQQSLSFAAKNSTEGLPT